MQNPARIGFNGVDDIWVDDVLNVGVDPRSVSSYPSVPNALDA